MRTRRMVDEVEGVSTDHVNLGNSHRKRDRQTRRVSASPSAHVEEFVVFAYLVLPL